MLSKTSQYALQAVVYLARHSPDAPLPANDVAVGLGIPANYLSKILHALSRAGVVRSERGPGGGYRLARPADRTSLADIVDAFDPIGPREQCLLGEGRCHDDHPCAAHARWREVLDPVTAFFRDTMVSELLLPSSQVAEPATA